MESYVKKWIALLGVIQVAVIVLGILACGVHLKLSNELGFTPQKAADWLGKHGTVLLLIPLTWSSLAGVCWKEDSPSQWHEAAWLASGIVMIVLLILLMILCAIPSISVFSG